MDGILRHGVWWKVHSTARNVGFRACKFYDLAMSIYATCIAHAATLQCYEMFNNGLSVT